MTTREQFGAKIKNIRESKHFTVRQAALQGGFSSAYLSQIENGNKNIPKVETLYRIAKGLRISNSEILSIAGITDTSNEQPEVDNSQLEKELMMAFDGKPIPEEDKQKLIEFAQFLNSQRGK